MYETSYTSLYVCSFLRHLHESMWTDTKTKILGVEAIKTELMKTDINVTLFAPSASAWDKVKDEELNDPEMVIYIS